MYTCDYSQQTEQSMLVYNRTSLIKSIEFKIRGRSASIKKLDSLLNFISCLIDDIKDKRTLLSLCYQVYSYPID